MQANRLQLLSVFSVLWFATAAHSAEIRGSIALAGSTAAKPARYVVRGQSNQAKSQTGGAGAGAGAVAVAIEFLDQTQTPTAPDTPYVMAQQGTAFVPNLLVVPVGARVTFPNRDAFFHNVFSYSPPRSFDLGRYPRGETRTVRFEHSGIVRIFCEIHSSMYASILVAPSSHYQLIETNDGFSFPKLPAGQYRVVALDAAGRKSKVDVTLESDQVADLSIILE